MWIILLICLLVLNVFLFVVLVGFSGMIARERDRSLWLERELKRAGIDVPPRHRKKINATREDIRS